MTQTVPHGPLHDRRHAFPVPSVLARRSLPTQLPRQHRHCIGQRCGHSRPHGSAQGKSSIRTQQPGSLTFPIVQALGHSVTTVSDDEVKSAMRVFLLRLKLLVEPTGAVPVALLLSGRLPVKGSRVGVILSGGNADPKLLAEVLAP